MMRFASSLVSFSITVCALACVMMAAEYLLPKGSARSALEAGTGILFLAAMIEQIAGIFTGNGV